MTGTAAAFLRGVDHAVALLRSDLQRCPPAEVPAADTSANAVLMRLQINLRCHTDVDLARHLGVSRDALVTWRTSGRIDAAPLAEVARERALDLNWLITGRC